MNKNRNTTVLIIGLLLVSLVSGVIFYKNWNNGDKVIITVSGKLYGKYPLDKNQTIDVVNGDYINIVKIVDGSVDVVISNCENQVCVNEYPISKEHPFVIVCLPHEMIIELSE